jgi:hypothetical protein
MGSFLFVNVSLRVPPLAGRGNLGLISRRGATCGLLFIGPPMFVIASPARGGAWQSQSFFRKNIARHKTITNIDPNVLT